MEIASQEREIPTQIQIPIPISSSYGGGGHVHVGHMNILHDPVPKNHIIPTSAPQNQIPSNGPLVPTSLEDNNVNVVPYKKMVRYRECLKNHAASMGGNATDGCGEFMPSGVEGTLEALLCSACNCHRNFHRKEVEGEVSYNSSSCECRFGPSSHLKSNNRVSTNGGKLILGHHKGMVGPETLGYPTGTLIHSRPAHHHHHQQMMMSYNVGSMPSESDEQEGGGGGGGGYGGGGVVGRPLPPPHLVKKRFRTKFTQEQKEKMMSFAEKVGWKIQRQEENVVQSFCQEIGVKRRVLKVWMHNNKHNLAKKNSSSSDQNQI